MSALQELIDRRAEYRTAESKALKSQEYNIGGGGDSRRNRMADLQQIREQIAILDTQIAAAQSAASGVRRVRYFRTC